MGGAIKRPPTLRLRRSDAADQAGEYSAAPRLIHLKQFRRFGRIPAKVAIHPIVLQNSH
jgi:hypothetical protein